MIASDFRSVVTWHKQHDDSKDSEQVLYEHLEYMLNLIHKQPKLPSYY